MAKGVRIPGNAGQQMCSHVIVSLLRLRNRCGRSQLRKQLLHMQTRSTGRKTGAAPPGSAISFHIWGICPKSAWCHSSISLHGSAQYICSNLPPKAIAKVRGFIFSHFFPDVNFLARLRANFSPGATCFFRSGKYYL